MKKKSLIIGTSLLGVAASASIAFADVNQPQEIIMRPLTTPGSQLTVGGDLLFLLIPDVDTGIGLVVGGSYGVDDKIEVGASYGIAMAPEFDAKGPFALHAAYNVMEGNLSVAPDAHVGYDLAGEALAPLSLGARVRFRINDQLAVYSPGGQLSIALEEQAPIPPATEGATPIDLGLPVGVQFQASPNIHAFLLTSIGNIGIADSSNVFLFDDFLPLTVGGFFSPSNTLDLGASIGWPNLQVAEDIIQIGLHGRLHM